MRAAVLGDSRRTPSRSPPFSSIWQNRRQSSAVDTPSAAKPSRLAGRIDDHGRPLVGRRVDLRCGDIDLLLFHQHHGRDSHNRFGHGGETEDRFCRHGDLFFTVLKTEGMLANQPAVARDRHDHAGQIALFNAALKGVGEPIEPPADRPFATGVAAGKGSTMAAARRQHASSFAHMPEMDNLVRNYMASEHTLRLNIGWPGDTMNRHHCTLPPAAGCCSCPD
jgi:hypothetical protein